MLLVLLTARPGRTAEQGEWIDLFNGKDLSGWILTNPKRSSWKVLADGVVDNHARPSCDIYTEKWFRDFDAHVEFAIYPGSNAGLYLLGRYEIQILDSYGKPPGKGSCGALYQEVAPAVNASLPANEWQTFDITFRAARFDATGNKTDNGRITVVHNGKTILDDVEFDEPTGSRKRYNEEAPGPILIQGDHGPVKFRKFRVRGQVYDPPAEDAPGPRVLGLEIEPKEFPVHKASGVALTWRTPYNAYASAYRVYRDTSPDVPRDSRHLLETVVAKRSTSDCCFETDDTYYYSVAAVGPGGVLGPVSEAVGAHGKANQVETPLLSEASWAMVQRTNVPRRDRAYSRKPMSMGGKTYEKGIGMRSPSSIRMHVGQFVGDRPGCRFRATIGLDNSITRSRRAAAAGRFIAKIDGKVAFDSGAMTLSDGTKDVDVPVPAGTRRLELITQSTGPRGYDFCNWANARLERHQ